MTPSLRSIAVSSALAVSAAAFAGDINPPTGPVQETGRFTINPQTATFPILINQPGSYVLRGNLTLTGATNGIIILVSDVTLDLNGFTLDGAGVGIEGIQDADGIENIAIRNGTVRDFQNAGMFMQEAQGAIVENMRFYDNGFEGVSVATGGRVLDCVLRGNAFGIIAGNDSFVADCSVDGSTITGIHAFDRVTVRDCSVTGNVTGISIGQECMVSGNHVTIAGAAGGGYGVFQRNVGVGRSRIEGNHVVGYTQAIAVDAIMTLGEVFIMRNSVLNAGGLTGYLNTGNSINLGLSIDPDTADAWDNFWWVTIVRSADEGDEAPSRTSPEDVAGAPQPMDPIEYRRQRDRD